IQLWTIMRRIESDPNARSYTDGSLTAVADDDTDHMDLYTQNEAARVAVKRELRVAGRPANGNGNGNSNGKNVGDLDILDDAPEVHDHAIEPHDHAMKHPAPRPESSKLPV
ncbi:MAG TPA: hypothetical protein VEX16_02470, partial [Methyloceanibacter sp.]|nr:hypothetical protein [Methyloceanibacter sp.]